jgi:DNA-binding MarR family transcriptional regulator
MTACSAPAILRPARGFRLSSGLRMISALERLGLVHRSIDERDRRRTIVRLTDSGTERMATYFEKIGAAWQSGQTLAA